MFLTVKITRSGVAAALLMAVVCMAQTAGETLPEYRAVKSPSFDPAQVAEVADFSLRKGEATFQFEKGRFYFTEPVSGRVVSVVFIGRGRLRLPLPNDIERAQTRRFLKADSVDQRFSAAWFLFSDDTADELRRHLQFRRSPVPDKAPRLARDLPRWLLQQRSFNLWARIAADMANRQSGKQGRFFAALEQKKEHLNFPGYLLYSVDPEAVENTALVQYLPKSAGEDFYLVNAFNSRAPRSAPDRANRGGFTIEHYNMKVRLHNSGKAQITATLDVVTRDDSLRALSFDLMQKLSVDSVLSSKGKRLAFVREKDESGVTVFLPEAPGAGGKSTISICYSGAILEQRAGAYRLKRNLDWYPRNGYLARATYDITYAYPDQLQVVAVGEELSRHSEGGLEVARWRVASPVIGVSFSLGQFDSSKYNFSGVPITILSRENGRKPVRTDVANDIGGALHFFGAILPDFPFTSLRVVETPGLNSNGYPGTLFLTALSFQGYSRGVMTALRAHELTHEWWGNLVGWDSYHDQWLSEAFAEYCGVMATQFLLRDDQRFRAAIEGWRNDLLEKGHIGVSLGLRQVGFSRKDLANSEGLEAGPIWLGQRLGAKHPVDYYVNVYEKGAYVLHMLRIMLRDFTTHDDQRFLALLRDFVTKYQGKRATTRDFERVASSCFREDISWFFRQWLYETSVPTYVYDYGVETRGRNYLVSLNVEQREVTPNFRAWIPVTIRFEDGKSKTTRVDMSGRQKTFLLGPHKVRPERLVFNDYYGVLARVRQR